MKKILSAMAISLMLLSNTGTASSAPLAPTPNADGLDIFNAVNLLLGTGYTNNVQIQGRQTNVDQLWTSSGQLGSWMVIGGSAAYENTFGYYTDPGTGGVKYTLWKNNPNLFSFTGNGTADNPFVGPGVEISAPGTFGFYLYSDQKNYLYSETGLNSGGLDYMTTYSLNELRNTTIWTTDGTTKKSWVLGDSVYLVAWEDILGLNGDNDYDDMMFLVSKVNPVPEPATMLLFGAGLAGLAGWRRKKN